MASMNKYKKDGKVVEGKWRVRWRNEINKSSSRVFSGRKAAKEYLVEIEKQEALWRAGATDVCNNKTQNLKKMTVEQLAEMFDKKHLSKTDAKNRSYIDRIITKWHNHRLFQIKAEMVRPWLWEYINGEILQPNGEIYAVATIEKTMKYFRRMFKWGCENGVIEKNPLQYILTEDLKRALSNTEERDVVISQEQFWALESTLPYWLKNICVCAWYTGMRAGEILNLTWENIHWDENIFFLKKSKVKEKAKKRIGIHPELRFILEKVRDDRKGIENHTFAKYVFWDECGRQIDTTKRAKAFRKFADKAGFKGLVFHDLRHCFVSRMTDEGHNKEVIKATVGHSDKMYSRYNNVSLQDIQNMVGAGDVLPEDIVLNIK